MMEPTSAQDLFKGRHFDQEIIILCVRWYLAFKLSSRDLVQMMAERGILLAHTTILRWVQQYVPEFEKRWNHYARPVGDSWRVDETYIKVRGQWVYLYRAVDKLKAAGRLPRRVRVRSSKYLNNVIEQDHRRIKQRVRPMLGFKRFETAAVTIRDIEMAEKIKKQQFHLEPLTGQATTAPGIWTAVLAA